MTEAELKERARQRAWEALEAVRAAGRRGASGPELLRIAEESYRAFDAGMEEVRDGQGLHP